MDEILASIRRIIESGEDRTPGEAPNPSPVPEKSSDGAPSSAAAEAKNAPPKQKAESSGFDVHYLPSAFGDVSREVRESVEAPVPPTASSLPASDSLGTADDLGAASEGFSAKAAHASFGVGSAVMPQPLDEAASSAPPAENENSSQTENMSAPTVPAPAADFAFEFDDEQFEADLRSGGWEAEAERGKAEPMDTRVPQPANSQNRELPESVLDGASALLSAEAGDQVASAFGDLARAIREGHMRSMEEMAREMMRPMLQEWLDDNLPRIVERLVREEIERVARGARF